MIELSLGFSLDRSNSPAGSTPAGTAVTLQALTLSGTQFSEDDAPGTVIGAIGGRAAGSTLSLVSDSGYLAIDAGGNLLVGLVASTDGILNATLRETLAAAANSPRDTAFALTVANGLPTNTAAPAISGTLTVGQVLSVSNGTWTNLPTGYAYQWTRDGAAIAGATASNYTLVAADAGTTTGAKVTATNATGSRTANAIGGGPVPASPTPAFASSGLRVPDRTVSLSANQFSCLQVIPAKSPNRLLKNPRVFLPGFYCNNAGSTPTERQCPNQFKAGYALGIGTGAANQRYRARFGGSNWTMRGGAGSLYGYGTAFDYGILSDPIKKADGSDLVIQPNSDLLHCSIVVTALAADVFPSQVPSAANQVGNVSRQSTSTDGSTLESFLTSSGTISQSGNSPAGYGPMFMVAEDAGNGELVSFLLTGDSRHWGTGDFGSGVPATYNARGFQSGARAMVSLALPYANLAMAGSTPSSDTVHRYAAIQAVKDAYNGKSPATHTLSNHGNNGSLGGNIADTQNELAGLKALLGAGVRYGKATIPPRIGTSGNFQTVMGQTPSALDTYPSGDRATLNNFFLANVDGSGNPIWDFVIDVGLYGAAAKGLARTDPNWDAYRSRFPVRAISSFAAAWSGTSSITMSDQTIQVGDLLSAGASFVRGNIMGPVISGPVNNGNGTYAYSLQTGSYPTSGVSYAAGDPVYVVATADGTHEGPWLSTIESQAIIEWYNAGRPAKYPGA